MHPLPQLQSQVAGKNTFLAEKKPPKACWGRQTGTGYLAIASTTDLGSSSGTELERTSQLTFT